VKFFSWVRELSIIQFAQSHVNHRAAHGGKNELKRIPKGRDKAAQEQQRKDGYNALSDIPLGYYYFTFVFHFSPSFPNKKDTDTWHILAMVNTCSPVILLVRPLHKFHMLAERARWFFVLNIFFAMSIFFTL